MESKNVKMANDVVREPAHYKQGRYEVIDEMLIVFGPQKTYDFCILNAWKYRARAAFKGAAEQDMDKANRYLEMAKEIVDKYSTTSSSGDWYQLQPIHLIKEDNDGSRG